MFGATTVILAKLIDPASIALSRALMDKIHDAADRLLSLSGQPGKQRELLAALETDERIVLCMWIMDMGMAVTLLELHHRVSG